MIPERHCKNCSKMLYAQQNYCSHCGSKWVDFRLTPKKITKEFTHRYLGTDNVFLVTLIALFRYPEDVINGFISGQRKKYVNPINFYIISLTLAGLQIFFLKQIAPNALGFDQLTDGSAITFMNVFYDYLGLFTTLLIPTYAVTGFLLFIKNKKYNFTEHMVFCIYAIAVINFLSVALTPFIVVLDLDYSMISLIMTPVTLIQFAWYYKRCLSLSFTQITLKTLLAPIVFNLITILYLITIGIVIMGVIYLLQPEWLIHFKTTNT